MTNESLSTSIEKLQQEQHGTSIDSLIDGVEEVTEGSSSSFLLRQQLFDEYSKYTNNNITDKKRTKQQLDSSFISSKRKLPMKDGLEESNDTEPIDQESLLRKCVDPIWNSLAGIDAENFLTLERVDVGKGARLFEGVDVRPIYEDITPRKHNYNKNTKSSCCCHSSCVRYLHIAEKDDKYSIGIFVLHPYARMPLHDHPEMCVISRVLYGDLRKTSLDLPLDDDDSNIQPSSSRSSSWLSSLFSSTTTENGSIPPTKNAKRAYKSETEYLQAPEVTMLFPRKGNLHEFVAGPNGAAVLDVLMPPYGDERDCTFYTIHHDNTIDKDAAGPCWIIPSEQPDNFNCLSGEYHLLHCSLFEEDDDDDNDYDYILENE